MPTVCVRLSGSADPQLKSAAPVRARGSFRKVLAWVGAFASERCPLQPGPGHMNAAAEPGHSRKVVARRIEIWAVRQSGIVSGAAAHHHLPAIGQLIDLNHGGAARLLLLRDPRFLVELIFLKLCDTAIARLCCLRAIHRCDRSICRG